MAVSRRIGRIAARVLRDEAQDDASRAVAGSAMADRARQVRIHRARIRAALRLNPHSAQRRRDHIAELYDAIEKARAHLR